MSEIVYFNRKKGILEKELVYGDGLIKFFYENFIGKKLLHQMIGPKVSDVVGKYHNLKRSSQKIPKFIEQYAINIDEYEKGSFKDQEIENSYKNFNEFFIRTFKKGRRNFSTNQNDFCAFSEARYFGYENCSNDISYPVKSEFLDPLKLLEDSKYKNDFIGGPLLIARLCPVDYHRYHYNDDGKTLEAYQYKGKYHSVNPVAIKYYPNLFIENEKRISILDTKNFGKIAYIEVGAMCVGKIIQSHDEKNEFTRGIEKGYFLFGASTVIVIGEKNKWKISDDIIQNTKEKKESYIQLGEVIGHKI